MNYPSPTDDELLMFHVDNLPSSAMSDYIRRNLLNPADVDYSALRLYFCAEFNRRMAAPLASC